MSNDNKHYLTIAAFFAGLVFLGCNYAFKWTSSMEALTLIGGLVGTLGLAIKSPVFGDSKPSDKTSLPFVLAPMLALCLWSTSTAGESPPCPPAGWTLTAAGQLSRPQSPYSPGCVMDTVARVQIGNSGGSGTCIAYDPATHKGLLLTCRHVVEGNGQTSKLTFASVNATARGTEAVCDKDGADLACIIFTCDQALTCTVVGSTSPEVGDDLWEVGYPHGQTLNGRPYNSCGKVLQTRLSTGQPHRFFSINYGVVTTNGDSGGGVFNKRGELVAVHWGTMSDSNVREGTAVATEHVSAFAERCRRRWCSPPSGSPPSVTIAVPPAPPIAAVPILPAPTPVPPASLPATGTGPVPAPPPAPASGLTPDQLGAALKTALQPMQADIAELKARKPVPGPTGPAGADGKPGAQGASGLQGPVGKDADPAALLALTARVSVVEATVKTIQASMRVITVPANSTP